MSDQEVSIPKRGNAKVAFLGVELKDAGLLIGSLFAGLICGSAFDMGNFGYVGIPAIGYFSNRLYIEWKSKSLPGAFRAFLFSLGLWGYSDALKSQKTLFVGDSDVINPASGRYLDQIIAEAKKETRNGSENQE